MLLFLATPCLVVVVQPCMKRIPIKKNLKNSTLFNSPEVLYSVPHKAKFFAKIFSA